MISVLFLLAVYGSLGNSVTVHLVIPKVVHAGSSPTLICEYDLEGGSLYSVKWYRGQYEFFRYVPREFPSLAAFPFAGINIDLQGSGAHQVMLQTVPKYISGKISCEVSVEETFRTAIDSANLTVLELRVRKPYLNVSSNTLYRDRIIPIICSAQETDPPPTINFYVDNIKVNKSMIQDLGNGLTNLCSTVLFNFVRMVPGEYVSPIWVRCDAFVSGIYHLTSASVAIIPEFPDSLSNSVRECPHLKVLSFIFWAQLLFNFQYLSNS